MKKLIIVFLSAAFLVSCGKDDNTTPENPLIQKYPFLKPGNVLEYGFTLNGSLQQGKATRRIVKDLGNGYFTEEATILSEKITSTIFANDTYVAWGEKNEGFFPLIFLNPQVGHTWTTPVPDDFDGIITRTIVEVGQTFESQAGTFKNCTRVMETISEDPNVVRYYYVSPAVGLIQYNGNGYIEDEQGRQYFEESLFLKSKNF